MGRPAQFCREEAVSIAMDAFWTKGYDVPVSELANAMSITRSSFYNCFKTREALFDDVLDLYGQSTPDYFLSKLSDDAPILPAIRRALKALCHDRANDPEAKGCLLINCLAQANDTNSSAPQLTDLMTSKIDCYRELLISAEKRGECTLAADARTVAYAIVTHMIGLNIMCKIVRSEDSLWQTTELVLGGLGLAA